jgi:hypothetical protein
MEGAQLVLCPVCNGRRETAPGMGCGACAGTGFIEWPRDLSDTVGGGLLAPALIGGILKVSHGVASLGHGAAIVEMPDNFTPGHAETAIIMLTIQEARGTVGAVYVSERSASQFTISSLSERDSSLVGWLIIG